MTEEPNIFGWIFKKLFCIRIVELNKNAPEHQWFSTNCYVAILIQSVSRICDVLYEHQNQPAVIISWSALQMKTGKNSGTLGQETTIVMI